jgi:predicted esterase
MKILPRIVEWSLIALIFVALQGCQSAPATHFDTTRPAQPEPPSSVELPTPIPTAIPTVAPTPTRLAPATPERDRESLRDQILISSRNVVASLPTPAPPPTVVTARPARPFADSELYLHLPPHANPQQPLRILLVLHGMGGQGAPFSQSLIAEADQNNWLVVAPTLAYRDYMDLGQLAEDDLELTSKLSDTLDNLSKKLNLRVRSRVLVYGFSRGAQLGHRFAMMYPERVNSVVAISAGSYTLPFEIRNSDKGPQRLPFPFGAGDLERLVGRPINWSSFRQVSFWIGVGDKDNRSTDVPRAFDPFIGDNRVERARNFEQALRAQGITVRLVIYPNVGHEITAEMRKGALQFLRERETASSSSD